MKALTLQQFRRMTEAYGADFSRWPAELREQARVLLETSSEARALVAEEAALDTLLQRFAPASLEPAFERRLNEIPLRAPRRSRFRLRALWAPALAWALAAVCGVWLGSRYPDDAPSATQELAVESDDALLELASGAFVDVEEEP